MSEFRIIGNGFHERDSLCVTCTMGMVVAGDAPNQRITRCCWGSPNWEPPFPVRECSAYCDRRQTPLYQMEEIAHVLVRGQRGKQLGFVTPDQYREMRTEPED